MEKSAAMDIKVLQNFLKIAEYENITKAAEELHIAQPHLTRQLKALEQELDVTLFVRERKRLHITEEGRFFRQQAAHIVDLMDKTAAQLQDMKHGLSGTLYIGATETMSIAYLPDWLEGFRQKYPDVKYNLWSGNSTDVTERLTRNLLDVALVREPFDTERFASVHLLEERWIAVMNPNHPLAQRQQKSVALEELSKEELLVPTQRIKEVGSWFTERKLSNHIICGFSPLMNAIIMAERSLGIAILPESARQTAKTQGLAVRMIDDSPLSGASVIWQRHLEQTGLAKRFIQYIQRKVASDQKVNTEKA